MGEEGVRVGGFTSNDVTEHRAGDEDLDEALEETFPASDAPANTVETGIRVAAVSSEVIDNREAGRFEVPVDGQTAVLYYERTPHSLVLVHTEVPRRSVVAMSPTYSPRPLLIAHTPMDFRWSPCAHL